MSENSVKSPKKLIAIGTSAGGLKPIQAIIGNLPDHLGSASIVVAQHLSPHYKSMMRELLARKTQLNVVEITDNRKIEANTIYTIPPDNDIIVSGSQFSLQKPEQKGPKPSVNKLFKSMASTFGSKSIGIILSGTGKDGAEGIIAIKKAGGITIVQKPETAKYEGMPMAALETGKVDYKLHPEEIGHYFKKLIGRVKNFKNSEPPADGDEESDEQVQETVSRVLSLLEEKVGTDFSNYKTSTIYRRLEKRLQDQRFTNIDKYLSYVQDNNEELNNLFQYLLIGVTEFFRDPESYKAFEELLEYYILTRKDDNIVRIWIPGCATGEEAYSMAIIACELINENKLHDHHVQIFATDIDKNALDRARSGIYEERALENVPDHILKNYFNKRGNQYEVEKHIRQMVLFTRHDLTSNPPFLKIDVISCRNLLIYFNQSLQNHVLPIFHYSLKSEGLLFLGKSETIGSFENFFKILDSKNKIFSAKETENNRVRLPHLKPIVPRKVGDGKVKNLPKEDHSLHDMVKETLYHTFEHPFVVIDESLEMVEIFGDVSPILKVKSGLANTNILKLLDHDLQMELRAVANQAMKSLKVSRGKLRKVTIDDKDYYLRLTVKPLMYSKPKNTFYMVIFERIDIDEKLFRSREVVYEDQDSPQVLEMEHELLSTREHMNTLVQELETSNEELQALNEELQSSNEELQASNEELETSNEELQASNEELEIAYAELRSANEEIRSQTEELKISEGKLQTLFNSTLQGFLLIDNNYNIDTSNKVARDFFKKYYEKKLTAGSSFFELLPEDNLERFIRIFRKVYKNETQSIVYHVNSGNKTIYLNMSFSPVEGQDEVKRVLISFLDITEQKNAELELKKAHEQAKRQQKIWEELNLLSPDLIGILNPDDLTYIFANPAYNAIIKSKKLEGQSIDKVFSGEALEKMKDCIEKVKQGQPHVEVRKLQVKYKSEEPRYFHFTFAPLLENKKVKNIIIYGNDITADIQQNIELKKANTAVASEKEKLEKLLTNAPAYIAVHRGKNHVVQFVSEKYKGLYQDVEVLGKGFKEVSEQANRQHDEYLRYLDNTFKKGESSLLQETNILSVDGKETFFNINFQPWYEGDKIRGVITFASDITDQVLSRRSLETNISFINALNDSMPQKVWTASPRGVYDYLNKPMRKYLGIGNGQYSSFTPKQWYRFIHPDDRKKTADAWQKSLKDGMDYKLEHRLKDSRDNFKWHLTRGLPLKNDKNKIIKWIGTSTDIDEQKRSEQMKDEFLSIASHELKTPLTTIQAYTDLLEDKMKELNDEEAKIYVEKTSSNLDKLNMLISDLLDISRMQAGKFNFDKELIDFDEVVKEGVENVRHTTKSHNITVKGKTGKKVLGDQRRLEQVVINFLSNAIKYSPDENEVLVEISSEEGRVTGTIRDYGIGISEDHLENIFDRYYRANEKKHYISGLGIGLFITKRIMDMHNGTIEVSSEEGNGSTFSFSIPTAEVES